MKWWFIYICFDYIGFCGLLGYSVNAMSVYDRDLTLCWERCEKILLLNFKCGLHAGAYYKRLFFWRKFKIFSDIGRVEQRHEYEYESKCTTLEKTVFEPGQVESF